MTNPWTKKNPFMSLWLSGANRAAGAARGQAMAQARKQQADATRSVVQFWSDAWFPGAKPKRKRKT